MQIFRSPRPAPLVVHHAETGEELWRACRETGCPDSSLAVVNGVDWKDGMTPWPIPPISEGGAPSRRS